MANAWLFRGGFRKDAKVAPGDPLSVYRLHGSAIYIVIDRPALPLFCCAFRRKLRGTAAPLYPRMTFHTWHPRRKEKVDAAPVTHVHSPR